MSMHLHHPSLSLQGKKKGKVKFRNAAEAQKARELAKEWENLKEKWAVPPATKKSKKSHEPLNSGSYKLSVPPGRESKKIPSFGDGVGNGIKSKEKVYTGTKVLGIATMHKSNAVPVFAAEDAIEISRMRRG